MSTEDNKWQSGYDTGTYLLLMCGPIRVNLCFVVGWKNMDNVIRKPFCNQYVNWFCKNNDLNSIQCHTLVPLCTIWYISLN